MCPPTRYTASSPSVNSTRLRRSATAKMFFRLSASMVLSRVRRGLRHHLCRAAGGSDLFGRLAAELVRPYRERLGDVAAGEHLDVAALADEPVLAQQLRRDLGAGVEPLGDRIEVHHLVLDAERIVEPALRHAAVERHLTALESALVLEPGTRLGALVSAAGGLAVTRPLPAADALLRVLGALRRTQIAQIHDGVSRLLTDPVLRPLPGGGPSGSCRASPACPPAPRCGRSGAGPCSARRGPGSC